MIEKRFSGILNTVKILCGLLNFKWNNSWEKIVKPDYFRLKSSCSKCMKTDVDVNSVVVSVLAEKKLTMCFV